MTDNISYSQQFFFSELAKIMNKNSTQNDISDKNIIISSDNISAPNNSNNESDNNEDICLITKEKLHPNHITLSCNHKFNYIPIYKEISYQKNKNNTSFEITKLSYNEIKCPYCRQITNKLLPYIPYSSVKQVKFVNSPQDLCMASIKCQHVFKNTHKCNTDEIDNDNDSSKCDKNALYYEKENVLLCIQHFRQYEKRMKSIENKKAKLIAKKQEKNAKKILVPRCQAILKTGKNIGKNCNRIISTEGETFCKIHL